MTLHWWMHWFWVTAQIVVSLTSPATLETSQTPSRVTVETIPFHSGSPVLQPGIQQSVATRMQYETTETLARLQQSYRIAKAIGIQPTTDSRSVTTDSPPPQPVRNLQQQGQQQQHWGRIGTTSTPRYDRMRSTVSPSPDNKSSLYSENKSSTQPGRIPGKKETKITWIHAFSKPPRLMLKTSSPMPPIQSSELSTPPHELTVMPLQEDLYRSGSRSGSVGNVGSDDSGSSSTTTTTTSNSNSTSTNNKSLDANAIHREQQLQLPSANRSDESQQVLGLHQQEIDEPRAIATVASIIEAGLVDSTRLGRARGTFTSEFQRDQLSREEQNKEEKTMKETAASAGANVTEIATITGSCLAIIILLSTLGSLGFIMYRRRYLNPPQTLNSDKCSNPDSSGYIDDSTIRDNSEEMYSLDNDSFLNSLEAMTIQNYWTDSVKHTKL